MRIVNAYTVSPSDIKTGDVMLFVVKAVVVRPGRYRLYRCAYDSFEVNGAPQGERILWNEKEICLALFPSLAKVAVPDSQ